MVNRGSGSIDNVEGVSRLGTYTLRLKGEEGAAFGSPVFAPSKDIATKRGYALLSSPKIYPGQLIHANLLTDSEVGTECRIYLSYYGENDEVTIVHGNTSRIISGQSFCLDLLVPENVHPVFEVGIELLSKGAVHLDSLSWGGAPKVKFGRPQGKGTMWKRAWVSAVYDFKHRLEPYRLVQNEGAGLLIQGSREWEDYRVEADVTPHLVKSVGLAGRVQGMRRYYSLVAHRNGELQLNKMLNQQVCLKKIPFEWSMGDSFVLSLSFRGDSLVGSVNGETKIEAVDTDIDCGGIALLVEEGRTSTQEVRVSPS